MIIFDVLPCRLSSFFILQNRSQLSDAIVMKSVLKLTGITRQNGNIHRFFLNYVLIDFCLTVYSRKKTTNSFI